MDRLYSAEQINVPPELPAILKGIGRAAWVGTGLAGLCLVCGFAALHTTDSFDILFLCLFHLC